MPKPRFSGGSRSIRRSSSEMVPLVTGSRPAMQLSAVVLPQPDGPSRQTNSPRAMVRVSSCSAATGAPPDGRNDATPSAGAIPQNADSFGLLSADLLVPFAERLNHGLGVERLGVRELGEPGVVFGPAELLEHVLAFLRRQRHRHVLHGRA